jgi:hypothetical protein
MGYFSEGASLQGSSFTPEGRKGRGYIKIIRVRIIHLKQQIFNYIT